MCGSATLTMVASSTTISCAVASTSRARPGRGPPPAVLPAAGRAVRVVLDRGPDIRFLLRCDLPPRRRGPIPGRRRKGPPGDHAGGRRAGHRRAIGPLRRRADRCVVSQELLYSRFERNGELRLPDFEQTPYVFAVFRGPGGG